MFITKIMLIMLKNTKLKPFKKRKTKVMYLLPVILQIYKVQ